MVDIKEIVEDIISMYAIVGEDMTYLTRMMGDEMEKTCLSWKEIADMLQKLLAIDPSIAYSYSNDEYDCYAVGRQEGNESHRVFRD